MKGTVMKPKHRNKDSNEMHPIKSLWRREINGNNAQTSIISRQIVNHMMIHSEGNFYRKNLLSHYGCINAIEFSNDGSLLASGGDDRRILLWNVHKIVVGTSTPDTASPISMQAEHMSNVFAVAFDASKQKIISAGNDDQVIVHDISSGAPLDYFVQEQPVFGVSADPVNSNIFSTACDDGRILIYDMREANDPFCLAKLHSSFHSVMFHPTEPRFILSSNAKEGAALWDVRMPKRTWLRYGRQSGEQCCMNARFNQNGSQVLALRRRRPPILYSTNSTSHLFQFNHSSYYNSCTMKSCSFGGPNDQFVFSGSDNFDVHAWEIPAAGSNQWVNEAKFLLKGHRSIVNQVRYNYAYDIVASSGVEKMVKFWSPFALPDESCWKNNDTGLKSENPRKIHSHEEYIRLILRTAHGQFSHAAVSQEVGRRSTSEDSRMMAFFDALVQRDIAGLSEDDTSGEDSTYTNTVYSTEESSANDDNQTPVSSTSPSQTQSTSLQNSQSSLSQSQPQLILSSDTRNEENEIQSSGVIDLEDLPILNSDDSDSSTTTTEANLSRRPIALAAESLQRAIVLGLEINRTSDPHPLSSDISLATAEPNTLTNMIAKKENLLRRLANEKPQRTSKVRRKFSRSAAAKRTLKKLDQQQQRQNNPSSSSSEGEQGGGSDDENGDQNTDAGPSAADLASPVRLKERRRSIPTTPVYESSNNNLNNDGPGPSYQYQDIHRLMTRTSHRENSTSSSSSSSSDLSSSDDDNDSKKTSRKVNYGDVGESSSKSTSTASKPTVTMKRSLSLSSSSSSSELNCTSTTTTTTTTTNSSCSRKRKRRRSGRSGSKKGKESSSHSIDGGKKLCGAGTPSDSGIEIRSDGDPPPAPVKVTPIPTTTINIKATSSSMTLTDSDSDF